MQSVEISVSGSYWLKDVEEEVRTGNSPKRKNGTQTSERVRFNDRHTPQTDCLKKNKKTKKGGVY